MRTLLALLLVWCAAPAAALAQEMGGQEAMAQDTMAAMMAPALEVPDLVLARAVVDREPQNGGTSFPADVGAVYCWTRVTGADAETQVEHVWYYNDQEVARVSLRVAGSPWRTWSSKTIPSEATGSWRVDVVGPSGAVLKSEAFTITEAAPATPEMQPPPGM